MANHFYFQILLLSLHIGLCSETACGRAEYQIGKECCPMCAPGNRVHKHCTEFTITSFVQVVLLDWILLLCLHIGLCSSCGRAEYQIGKECCPMCAPGNRVHKHCTEFTITSCIPCTGSTFLDQPNERTTCFQCRNCDPVSGLKVKQSCTSTSDAVCEPLEGYFCKLPTGHGCKFALEHSRCKPGQYISQQATSSKDTECSDCSGDTFSNGSLTSCQPHTKCESLDMVQVIPGNHSSDTTCETVPGVQAILIAIITCIVLIAIVGAMVIIYWKLQRKKTQLMNTERRQESNTISLMLPVPETVSPNMDM